MGGKRSDLMKIDGVSLKQVLLGEAAEHNLRSKNKVVQIGSSFFPLNFHQVSPLVSASHVRSSLSRGHT